ncbi:MAG: hypothetical protein QOJ55_449 [Solirubrobacteraceae bacterium]|nr:hypothetical protein [Solirubrobacteraceae bacterium]MDX6675932.1 hypothetical protein [Solirubrobacteraceae bacterium]
MTARVEGGRPVSPPPPFPPSPHRFMRRALLVTALLCLLAPASSFASTASEGNRVIRDCSSDGEINGKYSQGAYKYALSHLPSDLAEYTNCADAIRQAQAAAAGGSSGGGGGGGGGGGFSGGGGIGGGFNVPATPYTGSTSPSERSAIQGARSAGGAVGIGGGAPVTPGGPGITASTVTRALPAPLLALLILLALGAAGGASVAFRTRVLSRRQA